MDRDRAPEQRRGLAVLAERQVAQPLAGERAEVAWVAGERLPAVLDRAAVALREVPDGRPLVPALGEARGARDDEIEEPLRLRELALLQRDDPPAEERVHVRVARAVPQLPERRLGPAR